MGPRHSTPVSSEPDAEATCLELSQDEIRSHVPFMGHIVPGSVKLRSSSDAGRVSLTFKVNAPVACRVSVFLQTAEDAATGKIDRAPTVSVVYNRGFQQPFAHAMPGTLDHLRFQDGQDIIVIRVESFIASHANYTPNALPAPGAPLEHDTNAHTVLCCPRPQRDGSWSIEVLNERLWLAGKAYSVPNGLATIDDTCATHQHSVLWHQDPAHVQPQAQQQQLWAQQQQQQLWAQPQLWAQQHYLGQQQQQLWQAPVMHLAPLTPFHCMLCPEQARRPAAVQNTLCQHVCMCEPCGMEQAESANPCCPLCALPLESLVRVRAPVA